MGHAVVSFLFIVLPSVFCPLAQGEEQLVPGFSSVECKESYWVRDPEMEDGNFTGSLGTQCQIVLANVIRSLHTKELAEKIKTNVLEIRILNRTPQIRRTPAGTNRWIADVNANLDEEGTQIKIREMVTVAWDHESVTYKTDSKQIEASGSAGYLKHVAFTAVIKPTGKKGHYEIHLANEVAVERPWYALAPLFFAFSKGIAKDKFIVARQKILRMLGAYFKT